MLWTKIKDSVKYLVVSKIPTYVCSSCKFEPKILTRDAFFFWSIIGLVNGLTSALLGPNKNPLESVWVRSVSEQT